MWPTRNSRARLAGAAAFVVLVVCLLLAGEGPLAAAEASVPESEPPTVHAVRVVLPPALDGRLDDPAWAAAIPACGFRQRDPVEEAPASEDTCVRVVYDQHNLYVGVLAQDSAAAGISARIRRRDRVIEADDGGWQWGGDDAVAIALDPFLDRRNAVVFATNPQGAEFDALVSDEGDVLNHQWRTIWTVRAARGVAGWSAELAIPWRSLRYPAGATAQRFGIDVVRMLRRRHEESALAGWSRGHGGLHRVSGFATLEGLEGLPRGRLDIELAPFLVMEAKRTRLVDEASDVAALRLGLDAKWEVRPGLVLDATVRPDFSTAELDDLALNLDPYPLFLPERRSFFLENSGVFELGTHGDDEAPPFLMFFSRRIGYGNTGPLPVHGGLRLSGRAGRNVVGLMDVLAEVEPPPVDDEIDRPPDELLPPARHRPVNHAILRYKRDLGASGYLGIMLIDARALPCSDPPCPALIDQTAVGVDSVLWPTPTLRIAGFYARTGAPPAGGSPLAADAHRLALAYDDGTLSAGGEILGVGSAVDPSLGFVARTGIRRARLHAGVVARPPWLGLREIALIAVGSYTGRLGLAPLDLSLVAEATAHWLAGPSFGVWAGGGFETASQPWRVVDRLPAPAGTFRARAYGMHASSNPASAIVVSGHALHRDAFGGHFSEAGLDLRARVNAIAALTVSPQADWIAMGPRQLSYLTSAIALEVAPSTRLTFALVVQHRTLDQRFSAQARAIFTYLPSSDIELVLSEDRGARPEMETLRQRHAVTMRLNFLGRL